MFHDGSPLGVSALIREQMNSVGLVVLDLRARRLELLHLQDLVAVEEAVDPIIPQHLQLLYLLLLRLVPTAVVEHEAQDGEGEVRGEVLLHETPYFGHMYLPLRRFHRANASTGLETAFTTP